MDYLITEPIPQRGTSSVTLRVAQLEDARQIAEVHVATWQAAYRGILPDSTLDEVSVEARTELWQERLSQKGDATTLVLLVDGKIVGWIGLGPARDLDCDPVRTQQVYGLYLLADYWGQGHGKRLYGTGEDRMRQSGATEAILWVLRDNVRARRFYEGQGFSLDETRSEQAYQGDPSMIEVRYRKPL
jgi:ribosomal protein S18 acetylase RimI-like enzyme